jgi:cation diffusion facilitator CzcD-associated flavoprotein CzcO
MGGLNAAVQLKHAGIAFTLLEKNSGVGGTWYESGGGSATRPMPVWMRSGRALVRPRPTAPSCRSSATTSWCLAGYEPGAPLAELMNIGREQAPAI